MSPETQSDHAAILEMPYHKYVVSEFDPDCGRCDKCGGGEGAPEHQKPVDQMARIADALERIAHAMEDQTDAITRIMERVELVTDSSTDEKLWVGKA